MKVKELIENRDKPSAIMCWLHLFYNEMGLGADESMLHLSMGLHIKNVLVQDLHIDGRTLICVAYTDRKCGFHVYKDELHLFTENPSAHTVTEYMRISA